METKLTINGKEIQISLTKDQLDSINKQMNIKSKNFKDLKTFSDCCIQIGTTEDAFDNKFNGLGLYEDTIAYEKLKIVSKAINGIDFIVDWDNGNQKKWYPYFIASSGFGFSVTNCFYNCTASFVGSRLCFESEEKARHAGITFNDIYEIFLKKESILQKDCFEKTSDKVVEKFDYNTIKTYSDACNKLGISDKEPQFLDILPEFRKATIVVYKLFIIFKAINNGWTPNWGDSNERKYYPWKEVASSGFGFSGANYNCGYAGSDVGSRLCTDSSEKALYIGKQFEDLYLDWFCLEKQK